MNPLREAIRTKAEAGEPPVDSSHAGLLQNTPNWKHFSLSRSGDVGERRQERTGGNREFTGESMPWVERDFPHSEVGVLLVQA